MQSPCVQKTSGCLTNQSCGKHKVLEFKMGCLSDVRNDLEDFVREFPVGLGCKVVAELVMMNIYCFLFVFSLFMYCNEYITHYY